MSDPPREPEVPPLDAIVEAVGAHDPELVEAAGWQAATALVLVDDDRGPDVLFIERTSRPGDRWSGQMALPGGRREPHDPDLAATARRETREEVGVSLPPPVGRLDDHRERLGRGFVATFVYTLDHHPELVPEPREVAGALWIPLAHLLCPTSAVRYRYRGLGPFPGIEHDGRTVWGLTLGILRGFAEVIGAEIPRPRGGTIA